MSNMRLNYKARGKETASSARNTINCVDTPERPMQKIIHPSKSCLWQTFTGEDLLLRYSKLYSSSDATSLLHRCERELSYNTGNLAKVKMFGKLIDIPRKQVAHGDAGLSYTFSGNTVPALPWTPLLVEIRDHISEATGYSFNFVLINRYKDGNDYMGEHKDDEKDLKAGYPIASLSLGQPRDFVFKHQDVRGAAAKRRKGGSMSNDSSRPSKLESWCKKIKKEDDKAVAASKNPQTVKIEDGATETSIRKLSSCSGNMRCKGKVTAECSTRETDCTENIVKGEVSIGADIVTDKVSGKLMGNKMGPQGVIGTRRTVCKQEPLTISLEHGSLLLMEHPTNCFWYHSLPRRTRALGIRVNMTFRQMNPAQCKPVRLPTNPVQK